MGKALTGSRNHFIPLLNKNEGLISLLKQATNNAMLVNSIQNQCSTGQKQIISKQRDPNF